MQAHRLLAGLAIDLAGGPDRELESDGLVEVSTDQDLGVDSLDDDAVVKRSEFHRYLLV
jgi:hypothetical protein